MEEPQDRTGVQALTSILTPPSPCGLLACIMAVCVAVLDRNSTPLALATSDPDRELDFHYIVHTSIDVINEKCAGSTAGSSGAASVGQPGGESAMKPGLPLVAARPPG